MNYALFYLQKELYKHNLYIESLKKENLFESKELNNELLLQLEGEAKQIEKAIVTLSKENNISKNIM